MDFELGVEYIATAIENYQNEKLWLRWIHSEQSISFKDFKEKLGIVKQTEDNRSEETILNNVKTILNGWGGDADGNI